MLVSENQQETTMGWFCGILEGEGCFKDKTRTQRETITISNTNLCIIKACESFLYKHPILFKTYEYKRTKKGKRVQVINIYGDDCSILYRILGHKIECRIEQFQKIVGSPETVRNITVDLDWMIGIYQAEGTFYMYQNAKQIQLFIKVNNTNEKIIKKIEATINSINCAWHTHMYVPGTKKPYWEISINGMKRCWRFLTATDGLWVGKRDIARTNLMKEFIESRFSRDQGSEYNTRELEIYHQMNQLNS